MFLNVHMSIMCFSRNNVETISHIFKLKKQNKNCNQLILKHVVQSCCRETHHAFDHHKIILKVTKCELTFLSCSYYIICKMTSRPLTYAFKYRFSVFRAFANGDNSKLHHSHSTFKSSVHCMPASKTMAGTTSNKRLGFSQWEQGD